MATIPNRNDVLFGRGHIINAHPGNQRYRSLVEMYKLKFLQAKIRKEKRMLAARVVNEISSLDPSGRFLIESPDGHTSKGNDGGGSEATDISQVNCSILNKTWIKVDSIKVFEKVLHRLRGKSLEGSNSVYQSSSRQESLKSHSPDDTAIKSDDIAIQRNSKSGTGSCGSVRQPSQQQPLYKYLTDNSISGNELLEDIATPGKELCGDTQQPTQLASQDSALSGTIKGSSTVEIFGNVSPPISVTQLDGGADSQYNTDEARGASSDLHGRLDDELDSFLRDFSAQHDDQLPQPQEITLRQWIEKSKSKLRFKTGDSTDEVYKYVKSVLPVALKLTELIIEAEEDVKNGLRDPISLNSIKPENVHVFIQAYDAEDIPLTEPSPFDTTDGLETDGIRVGVIEVVDYVMIMSCLAENPDAGGTTQRLFALGIVLFELFSGEEPLVEEGMLDNLMSVNSINLINEATNGDRPRKKYQSNSQDVHSKCIARLECIGMPNSLVALIRNLFECSQGDFCGDEAYASFDDVKFDIQLMLQDASRFLNNIETNPMPHLLICGKLYGREEETQKLEQSYQKHINGECSGVIIKGGSGVGKSKLAMLVQKLTKSQADSYFSVVKFDQNKDVYPLATIGSLFNSLIDSFAQDATPSQLISVEEALEVSLGTQAALLAGVVESLSKLIPSCLELSPGRVMCVDAAMSIQYTLINLLSVLASHSRHISLLIDDLQWADPVSLLLICSLISNREKTKSVFFTCCYRDDEMDDNESFNQWRISISRTSLQTITLQKMTVQGVNQLISDTLHLSPRITQPLSYVLFSKTRGNPLFLKQLINSLEEKNLIYIQINHPPPRWAWDLNRIMNLKISDDVLALLMKEMQRLPQDLQLGLKLASCIGSSVKFSILDILSGPLQINMQNILQQVSNRGFMDNASGAFNWCHDKIQQAAYELMVEKERSENHIKLGLVICSHTMGESIENDELFFFAVNQINRGGPSTVHDPSQKDIIAQLNLKAGKRSISLSDFTSAFKLFRHGISFLGDDHWSTQYELSIDLFDAASDAACVIDDREAVGFYSENLVANARCYDDKLNCLYTASKVLRHADLLPESSESTFEILRQIGEPHPAPKGDMKLSNDMQSMNDILENSSDDSIVNMQHTTNKKVATLLKIYVNLVHILRFTKPSLIGAVSLRMVNLTMEAGLTPISALAFAHYGEILTSNGKLTEGCRLGRLALKLLEKRGLSSCKSSVICIVYQSILWVSAPIQSVVDGHLLGEKAGSQSGDIFFSVFNLYMSIITGFTAGQNLCTIRNNVRDFILKMLSKSKLVFVANAIMLHSQTAVLQWGLHVFDAGRVDDIPTEKEIMTNEQLRKMSDEQLLIAEKVHYTIRAFLFRLPHDGSQDINILETITEKKHQIRPLILMGIFFEGLACFQSAHESDEAENWVRKGESALVHMKCYSEYSKWNWENKILLLEAEKMYILRQFDAAESLYKRSMRSAREHKFVHEEAIGSELAGSFYYERGASQKALALLLHAQKCYEQWGALAVAKRVQASIRSKFDSDLIESGSSGDNILLSFFAPEEGCSNKRKNE